MADDMPFLDDADAPLVLPLAGQKFTVVAKPPQGAFLVLMRRLDDKDVRVQMAAVMRLLDAWIVPDERDRLYDAVSAVEDVEDFMENDLAEFIQAVTNRPTSGRAPSPGT